MTTTEVHGPVSTLPATRELEPSDILRAAEALVQTLRSRADEAAALRRLPDSTIAEAQRAGVFSLLLPRELGGAEGSARDFVHLVRTLARGDLASAWTLGFLTVHGWLMLRFPAEARAEMFVDGRPALVALSARPPGTARRVEGGYELTGRWGYCSGVMHAPWVAVIGLLDGTDDEDPSAVQGLEENASLFLLPKADVELLDTWHMAGMQGTGSHDVEADRVFVPAHRRIGIGQWSGRQNLSAAAYPCELNAYDTRDLLSFLFPAMAVGAAQGVLTDFEERIQVRRAAFTNTAVADTAAGQLRYARAVSALRLAEAALDRALCEVEQINGSTTGNMTHEQRTMLKLDCLSTIRMAWESMHLVLNGSGSSVFKAADPTQRVVRDMQVLMSHLTIDEDRMLSKSGEILLGRATDADPTRNFT